MSGIDEKDALAQATGVHDLFVDTAYDGIGGLIRQGDEYEDVLGVLAIISTIAVAALWRRFVKRWFFLLFRYLRVSAADRNSTAWETVIDGVSTSAIVIRKKNGSAVMCERLADFKSPGRRACILGSDGSVALYITHRRANVTDEWVPSSPESYEDWGAQITYIPASEIAEISLRAD